MAITITERAERESEKVNIEPQFVLEIDGLDFFFGTDLIVKFIRYGDEGLVYGGGAVYGGYTALENQYDYISLGGTSNTIQQQLRPDLGSVSSISSVQVQLIDKGNIVSQVISPGVYLTDILGRRAVLWFGFKNSAFKEDYVKIFAGRIDDVVSGPGNVKINIAHPDNLKRQDLFIKKESTLSAAINNSQTTIPVVDADTYFENPYTQTPTLTQDTSLRFFAKIEDEVIEYTSATTTQLTGVTRGALGTTATNHDFDTKVETFYVLEGAKIDLALKLMLSGKNGYYREGISVTAFEVIDPATIIDNAIFFSNINVEEEYGLVAGDYITTTGATSGLNNVTLKQIISITSLPTGSYIVVDGVNFVNETLTSATISFRSQYDTLGFGLGMTPEEVDVPEHHYWRDLYLNTFNYQFYIKDTIKAKDFLEKQIYLPFGGYSIPRKTKASMGFHLGPVPRDEIPIFDESNVRNPDQIKIRRTTSKNFYNTVVYKFDQLPTEEKYATGRVRVDVDSRNRIAVGNKSFTIPSDGIRSSLSATERIDFASERILSRYKYAAEFFEGIQVLFKESFNAEPGDLVLMNFDNLKVTNSEDGTREKEERFFEVINKSLNLKTGDVKLELLDTNFGKNERYGIISPSSRVVSATTTYAIIEDSFGDLYPGDEPKKWKGYENLPVLVHSEDFTYAEYTTFLGFDPSNRYKMLFATPLPSAPLAGYVIDIPEYPDSPLKRTNRRYKLFHPHLSPAVAIISGVSNTEFNVALLDVDKFQVGFPIRVHNFDFTVDSLELTVSNISGTTITVSGDMGFTPTTSEFVEFLGFADGDFCYRYI